MTTSQTRSRIILLCVPRSGSTSVLKCLSSFHNSEAWFEPYVICRIARIEYKLNTGKDLPPDFKGNEQAYQQAANYVEATDGIPVEDGRQLAYSYVKHSLDNATKRVVIAKDMGIAIAGFHKYLPSAESGYKYVFIIRDPYRAVTSYRKASLGAWKKLGELKDMEDSNYNLFTDDRFYPRAGGAYEDLHAAWKHVSSNLDPEPLIIDTEDLLSNPKACLKKICDKGGLDYDDRMMEWDSSSEPVMKWINPGVQQMMGNTLSDFHERALTSSRFHPSCGDRPARSSLTPDVMKAIDAGIECYTEMYGNRYKP